MSQAPIFAGTIDKGKLILDQPQRYLVQLSALNGKKIELILRKRRSQRSIQQNSAYWGLAVEILCNHTGYDKETMHAALKHKFASHVDGVSGLTVVESTTKMDTKRFMKYYEDIQRWAAEYLHVYIPSPNEVDYSRAVNE
ncbi:MAG: hypothetical protein ACOYOS_21860 [Syntrophales bacterium]